MTYSLKRIRRIETNNRRRMFFRPIVEILEQRLLLTHDLGVFELDRNAVNDPAVAGDDWNTVLLGGGGGSIANTGVVADPKGATIFTTGGSKDDLDISQWRHTTGSVPDKDEITNSYSAVYASSGSQLVYFGADRFANNGDAQIGFWFFKNKITVNSNGTFSGLHSIGDVLVLSDFTQGGTVSTIKVYKWVGSGGSFGTLDVVTTGADSVPGVAGDSASGTVNTSPTAAPWPYTPKSGSAGTFPRGSFYEGGVNLSALGLQGCFSSFLAETRSSQSVDATLKDFSLSQLSSCDANIRIAPSATNEVGTEHVFTVTVNKQDASTGFGSGPAAGAVVTASLINTNNASAVFVDDGVDSNGDGITGNDAVTDASGQARIAIRSSTAGITTVSASAVIPVNGSTLTRTTNGIGKNSGPAVKRWVDANIAIAPPTAVNEVGQPHTIIATVKQDDGLSATQGGDGVSGFANAPNGTVVVFSLINSNGSSATFVDDGVDSNGDGITGNDAVVNAGKAQVRINSGTAGLVTINATTTFIVGGVTLTRDTNPATAASSGPGGSGPATKRYVDANIALTPPTAVNGITEPHAITATVKQNDGLAAGQGGDNVSGFANAPNGTVVAFTLTNSNGATASFINDGVDSNGDGITGNDAVVSNGLAVVRIVSATAGTVTINASTTFAVGGITLTRDTDPATASSSGPGGSGPATKIYVAGALRWLKTDDQNKLLGGATFVVTRTHTFNTATGLFVDTPDVTSIVVDDTDGIAGPGPDADPDPGEFQMNALVLGRYTIRETIAPTGYFLDPDTEIVELTTANPSNVDGSPAIPVFINRPGKGKIAPTDTTCQTYLGGTAADLNEVIYSVKAGKISQAAPGVFFYYTQFTAPSSSFTIVVDQSETHATYSKLFTTDLSQVRLFNASCTTLTPASVSLSDGNGDATLNVSGLTPGQVYVVSVKYSGNSVVGTAAPNPTTVHYDFVTKVNGTIVDMDSNGLDLKKKSALMAGSQGNFASGATLSNAELQPIVEQAKSLWLATGLDAASQRILSSQVRVEIADLDGRELGLATDNTIWLDRDAAGFGWSIGTTGHDHEFDDGGPASYLGHMDLLSVVSHELGHLIGLDHDHANAVMHETLSPGVRRSPGMQSLVIALVGSTSSSELRSTADESDRSDLGNDLWETAELGLSTAVSANDHSADRSEWENGSSSMQKRRRRRTDDQDWQSRDAAFAEFDDSEFEEIVQAG